MPKDDTPSDTAAEMELRASNTDRERVAEALREAAGQGRIDMDELDERLEAVYAAKTYGELLPITRDLPADDTTPQLRPSVSAGSAGGLVVGTSGTGSKRGWAIAIMSGAKRRGSWIVPRRFGSFAFWGGVEIDLTEARFQERVTVINAMAIMAGVQVMVPEDVRVEVRGLGLMGAFHEAGSQPVTAPDAPVVRVKGIAFWGGVQVRRVKRRKTAKELES